MKNMFAIRPSQRSANSPSSSRTRLKTSDKGSNTELRDRMRQKSFFGVEPYALKLFSRGCTDSDEDEAT